MNRQCCRQPREFDQSDVFTVSFVLNASTLSFVFAPQLSVVPRWTTASLCERRPCLASTPSSTACPTGWTSAPSCRTSPRFVLGFIEGLLLSTSGSVFAIALMYSLFFLGPSSVLRFRSGYFPLLCTIHLGGGFRLRVHFWREKQKKQSTRTSCIFSLSGRLFFLFLFSFFFLCQGVLLLWRTSPALRHSSEDQPGVLLPHPCSIDRVPSLQRRK